MFVDKDYCMSSFLQFRFVENERFCFTDKLTPKRFFPDNARIIVNSSEELFYAIRKIMGEIDFKKSALMLSGGIDSAILAKFMPRGSRAYTLKCDALGAIDETQQAFKYADECGLDLHVVDVTWDDYLNLSPKLVISMGQPVHSIEPQICKAALQAKIDGYNALIFGETADIIYGGLDGLLSKEWRLDEFVHRHNFVDPTVALKNGKIILEPYLRHFHDGKMDVYGFLNDVHLRQSPASYINACNYAGIDFIAPFSKTKLGVPIDINRIRSGDNKYIVREIFAKLYPNFGQPVKVPLPRALNIWLKDYDGPIRDEFIPHCTNSMTADQKWYVFILELFLNELDKLSDTN